MTIGAIIIWQFIGIDWSIQMCRYSFLHDMSKNPEKNQKCFTILPGQPKEKSSVTALYRNKERFLPGPETSAIISSKLQWVKQLKTSSVFLTKISFTSFVMHGSTEGIWVDKNVCKISEMVFLNYSFQAFKPFVL